MKMFIILILKIEIEINRVPWVTIPGTDGGID